MSLDNVPANAASDALMSHIHEDWDTSDDEASATSSEFSADENVTTAALEETLRCKYPSKFCGRARARKSNGTFHRFCQYHRNKANTNQKRWTSVRREQAALEEQRRRVQEMLALGVQPAGPLASYDSATPNGYSMPALLPDPVRLELCPQPVELPLEDVHILNALLVDEMADKHSTLNADNHCPLKPIAQSFGWGVPSPLVEPDTDWYNT